MRASRHLLGYHIGRLLVLLVVLVGLVVGCTSSGDDEDTSNTSTPPGTTSTTVTGTVSAPGAQLAQVQPQRWWQRFAAFFVGVSTAQSSGLLPVGGANILVFIIDDNGNPVGDPIATGNTDSNGVFSVELPEGTTFASNLIIQASNSTTPAAVNAPEALDCPVVQDTLNIDPAAEVATRAIIQNIAAAGGSLLSNYTPEEVAAFVDVVQSLASDGNLAGSTVAEVVDNLNAELQNVIDIALDGIEGTGAATPPANLGGAYTFVGFFAGMEASELEREQIAGTITLNPTTNTFSVDVIGHEVTLSETCPVDGTPCDRTLTQNTAETPETLSGTYQVGGNGQLFLSFNDNDDDADDDGGDNGSDDSTALGAINPDGSLIVFPITNDSEVGLVVAVQQGSDMSTTTLNGTFNFNGFFSSLPMSGNVTGTWNGMQSGVEGGTLTFDATSFAASSTGSDMQQVITCTIVENGCRLSAMVNGMPFTENFAGTVALTSTGGLTLTETGDPDTLTGQLSPDGHLLVLQENSSDIEPSILVGTRQGANLSNASLNGTYNLSAFEDLFESDGSVEIGLLTGAMTFDGNGNWSGLGLFTGIQRTGCQGEDTCPFYTLFSEFDNFTATGTYTVTASGQLTITGAETGEDDESFTLNGSVGENGQVLLFQSIVDNEGFQDQGGTVTESQRIFGIAVAQTANE